ncbi:MAG: HYR domain-containing protein [Bacteroidetes bacterium]|nr:HYR domain-containing protein [Bacteroidota bacterium]
MLALAGFSAGALQAQVPTVTAFSPSSGSCGTTVVITGTDFSGVTGVKFGGANAALFTVNSSTEITATVAGSASGSVTVENGNGTGSMAGFTHLDVTPPTLTCPTALTINNSPGLCTGATTLLPPAATDNCDGIGNGLDFDGGNDYVAFNGFNITTNTLTIECWIKPNGPQSIGDGLVYRRGTGVATGLSIGYVDPTRIGYNWNDNSNTHNWTGGPVYNLNVWNHVALVIEPGQATIYLNGVGYVNAVPHPAINLSGLFRLGQDDLQSRLFNGVIDEVRVWNYSRTQAQIQANMQQELNAQPGLLRVYHLNEGVPAATNTGITSAADASGNNASGTLNNFALSGAASNWVVGTATIPNAVFTNNAPGTYQMGNTSVVWTATDPMGNSSTCTQTVTVVDNEAPVITCPGNQILNAGTNCTATATYSATATDLCSTHAVTYSPVSGSDFALGTTTVTATATDSFGNSAACSFTVTVNDVTPPTLTCPTALTINTSPGLCTGATTLVAPLAPDNCGGLGNGLKFDGGDDYVGFNGFNITSNTLTIECWIKPNGPQSATDGIVFRRSGAVATGLAIGDSDPTRIGYTWNNQTNSFSWTGGPVYNVNVWNHVALVIEPSQATIYLNGVGYVNPISHPAINLSGIFRLGQDDFASRLFNGAIDEVRVWDYSRTQAQIQANMQLELNAEPGLLRVYHLNEGAPTASNTGITTAADASGNNTSGTLNNFALSGAASNWVAGTVLTPNAAVTGNAPGIFPIGNTSVVWTATDAMGNSSTCAQTVTVVDNEAPVVTCPGNIVVAAGPGCVSTATVTYSASMTDNCAGGSVTFSPASGSTFSAGVTTVTATATDASSNSATCAFTVTVTVPALLTVAPSNSGNVCVNANTASVLANASGGTPGYTYLWSPSNLTTSSLTGVGAGTHSVTVTDARGCTATGSTTVGTHPVTPSTFNVSQ